MAKVNQLRSKSNSHRSRATPYSLLSQKVSKHAQPEKSCSKASEKKDWENATCSVCMEFPHNAVLLLCSSYNKGCRPYMCATSHRYSNCLEQYKKAYTKATSIENSQDANSLLDSLDAGHSKEKQEVPELLCPLCRGQVKGWTVVEPARKYLNAKKRTCMQENCSFVGTYKELRKHVKAKHPSACPRAVDPVLEEKWKRLEGERERNDVISTIISSTPGAVVLGDYVLEPSQSGFYSDYDTDGDEYLDGDGFFPLESFDFRRRRGVLSQARFHRQFRLLDEDNFGMYRSAAAGSSAAAASGRGFRRIIFGRSRRRGLRGPNRDR